MPMGILLESKVWKSHVPVPVPSPFPILGAISKLLEPSHCKLWQKAAREFLKRLKPSVRGSMLPFVGCLSYMHGALTSPRSGNSSLYLIDLGVRKLGKKDQSLENSNFLNLENTLFFSVFGHSSFKNKTKHRWIPN